MMRVAPSMNPSAVTSGRSSSVLRQMSTMLWRNFLLAWRRKLVLFSITILIPVFLSLMLLLLQYLYKQEASTSLPHPESYAIDYVTRCTPGTASGGCITALFAPNSNFARTVMSQVSAFGKNGVSLEEKVLSPGTSFSQFSSDKLGFVGFQSTVPKTDFFNFLMYNQNTTKYAVHFIQEYPTVEYQIWFNATQSKSITDLYLSDDLLSLQVALDEAILSVASSTANTSTLLATPVAAPPGKPRLFDFSVKGFPKIPPTSVSQYIVQSIGVTLYFCPLMVVFIMALQNFVWEKEMKLRPAMEVMGLRPTVFWASHILFQSLLVFITSLACTVMGIICGFDNFTKVNFFVVLMLFFVFGFGMLCFAGTTFFLSTVTTIYYELLTKKILGVEKKIPVCVPFKVMLSALYKTTRQAVLTGMVTLIVGMIVVSFLFGNPFIGLLLFSSSVPSAVQFVLSRWPAFNFGGLYGVLSVFTQGQFDYLTQTQVEGPGFSYSDLWQDIPSTVLTGPYSRLNNLPVPGSFLIFTLIDCAIFLFLAWIFENIVPDEFGNRRGPLFFLSPSYWGFQEKVADLTNKFISTWQNSAQAYLATESTDPGVQAERELVFSRAYDGAMRVGNLRKIYSEKTSCCRRANKKVAVNSLCLTLREGNLLALLGQNGAGKSTTMNCLSGMIKQTSGDALFYGFSISKHMGHIHSFMGICPQFDILFDELTPIEHIRLYAGIKNIPERDIKTVAKERLTAVRLFKVKDKPVKTFSGGMKRRLSVLISTLGDPRIIFLDEPTTGMDPVNRRHVWSFLEAFKENRVIILTTHSMEEADILGDTIAVMARGHLRAIGTSVELKSRYGSGYRIGVIARTGRAHEVKQLLAQTSPNIVLEDESAGSLLYRVPPSHLSSIPRLITTLDSASMTSTADLSDSKGIAIGAIESWGVSQTTLEEVFLTLIRSANEEHHMASSKKEN